VEALPLRAAGNAVGDSAAQSIIYRQDTFSSNLTSHISMGFHEALIFIGHGKGGVVRF
jgi:hypothetical protein